MGSIKKILSLILIFAISISMIGCENSNGSIQSRDSSISYSSAIDETSRNTSEEDTSSSSNDSDTSDTSEADESIADISDTSEKLDDEILAEANLMATQYDYDGAIELLQATSDYDSNAEYQRAVQDYQNEKEKCVSYPVDKVTHIFFHTLIKDTAKAFDGDPEADGYNQVMTTIDEFNKIIDAMYKKGYVMISLHDMCGVNDDGTVYQKEIYLPEGKIPFVLSQDDVSYYHYMDDDGFASKLIVDENGEVKNTYIEDDGSVSVGNYDMVPLIDEFVKEHPDFSYHGHKGIVALTGYEGVLGYRTDEVYLTREESRITKFQRAFFEENPDFDEASFYEEVAEATEVATAMKEEGWEFASHTWGHIDPRDKGLSTTTTDAERWAKWVEPIVGDTDVMIFAFGADIADWKPYEASNKFFQLYKKMGFNIFCNVDETQYWVQFGDNYMRQGRRNVDGVRMYYNPDLLADLFDVKDVWDSARPTPVPKLVDDTATTTTTTTTTDNSSSNNSSQKSSSSSSGKSSSSKSTKSKK